MLQINNGHFLDESGRKLLLKGINLDGGSKLPSNPPTASYDDAENCHFFDGDSVSFVGRPFPLKDAQEHLTRIKSWGYNCIRYVITWEALEHEGPGIYDEEFINYTIEILKEIDKVGGLYVIIDPHQDVWSRFTGGSGAPMWTLYAAGLDPRRFVHTQAAIVHNTFPEDRHSLPKMVWTTNYFRLASLVMFTMFFSGRKFMPDAVLNSVNIQDFLQSHFVNAFCHLTEKLKGTKLLNRVVIGVETLNEPNEGLWGYSDLNEIPASRQLRVDTTPTPFECFKLGSGIPCEVPVYEISVFGPVKSSTRLVNSSRESAWLQNNSMDRHYGFQRGSAWRLGSCIFKQLGIWDGETLLKPDFFASDPDSGTTLDKCAFVNGPFVEFYNDLANSIRSIDSDLIIFMQPPVFAIPPKIVPLHKTVLCQHYYDGMSLMFKTWNRLFNVDTLGIMRGRYMNPVFGLVIGEGNIRNSFRDQFREMKKETEEAVGKDVPMVITETGMPFDMGDTYETNDFSSQISALDALGYAMENNNLSHTYWCYSADNCHEWGDRWNNEDFSFYCKQDVTRANPAIVRPFPLLVNGDVTFCTFDLKNLSFTLKIDTQDAQEKLSSLIFLPKLHFSKRKITVSEGTFKMEGEICEWSYPAQKGIVTMGVSEKESCIIV